MVIQINSDKTTAITMHRYMDGRDATLWELFLFCQDAMKAGYDGATPVTVMAYGGDHASVAVSMGGKG